MTHNSDQERTATHGYISDKDQYLRRLGRIEGQARGLQNMVEDEQYCINLACKLRTTQRTDPHPKAGPDLHRARVFLAADC